MNCLLSRRLCCLIKLRPVIASPIQVSSLEYACVCAYLYALIQTLEGVDVQSLLAGLQTGNDFLTLDLSWSDSQSR